MAKDFVEIVDSDEDLRKLMMDIDQASSVEELDDIAFIGNVSILNFLAYLSQVKNVYRDIEEYFFDEAIDVLTTVKNLRGDHKSTVEKEMEDVILSDLFE